MRAKEFQCGLYLSFGSIFPEVDSKWDGPTIVEL